MEMSIPDKNRVFKTCSICRSGLLESSRERHQQRAQSLQGGGFGMEGRTGGNPKVDTCASRTVQCDGFIVLLVLVGVII